MTSHFCVTLHSLSSSSTSQSPTQLQSPSLPSSRPSMALQSTFIAPALSRVSAKSYRSHSTTPIRTRAPCVQANAAPPNASTVAAAAAAAALVLLTPVPSLDVSTPGAPPTHVAGSLALARQGDTFASGFVNKDGESLLRWSLPINNKPVRELQAALESVIADIKGLKWAKMDQDVKRGSMILNVSSTDILASVPEDRRAAAEALLAHVKDDIPSLEAAIQEKNTDKITARARDVLRDIGRIEERMVTAFPFNVPPEYSSLPQLKGRATVEVVVRKADDERFDIEGILYKEGKMTIVVDGYSAPVNAGAFVDLVSRGFYDGLPVIRSDGFIIQTGKPEQSDGFVDEKTGDIRLIPLEVFAKGDKLPLYGATLEDDGRGSSSTVLPFSSYGTMAMARREFEPNTASSQFFWFLFEPDLTPAGRNLLDGAWSVFGYTVDGEKFLKGLQKGDRIVSAKVVSGIDNLQRPVGTSS